LRVKGLELRFWVLGFSVWGARFEVQGKEFRISSMFTFRVYDEGV